MKARVALPSAMFGKLPLYLSLLLLTQCSKCKRDDPTPLPPKDPLSTLPPETAVGKNTFACLVNGKAFIAPYTTSANGDWQSLTRLAIGGTMRLDGQGGGQMLTITAAMNGQLQGNQSFSLISNATPFPIFTPGLNQCIADVGDLSGCFYGRNFANIGRIELVTFDGVRRIAAGRFAFTLSDPGCGDTLRVTNGRFDVKF